MAKTRKELLESVRMAGQAIPGGVRDLMNSPAMLAGQWLARVLDGTLDQPDRPPTPTAAPVLPAATGANAPKRISGFRKAVFSALDELNPKKKDARAAVISYFKADRDRTGFILAVLDGGDIRWNAGGKPRIESARTLVRAIREYYKPSANGSI